MAEELRSLIQRCDEEEGVQEDGSNMDTSAAHAALFNWDRRCKPEKRQ